MATPSSTSDDKTPLLAAESSERIADTSQPHKPSDSNEQDNTEEMLKAEHRQIGIGIPRPQTEVKPRNDKNSRNNLKYVALVALVAQNASLVLLMRYVKTRPNKPQFTNSTAVVCCETLKLLACLAVVFTEVNNSFSAWIAHLHSFLVKNFLDTLKVAVPAFIYSELEFK